jgi:sulfur relay (sulfurtransferase) complex TusBCD TusD component (DsrE family)
MNNSAVSQLVQPAKQAALGSPWTSERVLEMAEKLGIFLSTSPESENTHTVIKLAEAALERGHEVHIFIMCDGVHNAFVPGFEALVDKGARLVLCSHNLAERHRPKIEGTIVCGSQYDHAQLVSQVDRYLAFNA